ncbi:MAG: hypothetical protein WC959_00825 [Kiritimatiellales bacterium]
MNWLNLMLWMLPVSIIASWLPAIEFILSSLFLIAFLRLRNCGWISCVFGALIAYWLGSNFTLIYAGHFGKFGVVLFAAVALYCIEKMFQSRNICWALLSGGALGIMFLEQQDSALFFGLFLGAYVVYRWILAGEKIKTGVGLVLIPAVALLIAAGTLSTSFKQNISDTGMSGGGNREEQWEYCTQWSQPPDEMIDVIAPGYTGWRSGEPDGPYWGKMGRSAGWEFTRQGFMNFKLENIYLGIIPVAFLLFAIPAARGDARRQEIWFWSGAGLFALLLSFGKFTPLYYWFWQLPVANAIRNPNKFTQVFQVIAGILTAFGADLFFKKITKEKTGGLKIFFWSVVAAAGFFALFAVSSAGDGAKFSAAGWPQQAAQAIAKNKTVALWHAALLTGILAFIIAVYVFPIFEKLRKYKTVFAALLVGIVVVDAKLLSTHYVNTMPKGYIADNSVISYLKENIGDQRVAVISQDGIYNIWLTYTFPYHGIPAFNFTQMPRMPQDYKIFLETVGRNPLRMWQLSGVGFLIGPTAVENQLPAGLWRKVLSFDILPEADNDFNVQISMTGQHSVFKAAPETSARCVLVNGSEKLADDAAQNALASPAWTPFKKIILPPESSAPEILSPAENPGTLATLDRSPGFVRLKINTTNDAFLRCADKYDPGWTAAIDGVPAEVLRADFICQAVFIPAGEHIVELKYAPENNLLWLQFAGFGICGIAGVSLLIPARRKIKT